MSKEVVGGKIQKRKYNKGWFVSQSAPALKPQMREKDITSIDDFYNSPQLAPLKSAELREVVVEEIAVKINSISDLEETTKVEDQYSKGDFGQSFDNLQPDIHDKTIDSNTVEFKGKETSQDTTISLPFWKNYPFWAAMLLLLILTAFVFTVIGLFALGISFMQISKGLLGLITIVVGIFIFASLMFFSIFTIYNNKRHTAKELLGKALIFASYVTIAGVVLSLLFWLAVAFGGS